VDLDADSVHTVVAYAALLLGVAGPVVALAYSLRVDRRDFWRVPMLVSGVLTFLSVLGAYLSGRWLVDQRPGLASDPLVAPHVEYADRLLMPGIGFVVLVVLTGALNPRTGLLKTVLPLLLSCFGVVVLLLVLLSGDSGARELYERLRGAF